MAVRRRAQGSQGLSSALWQISEERSFGPHMAQVGEKPGNPWGLRHQMSYIEAVEGAPSIRSCSLSCPGYPPNGYMGTSEDAVKMWAAYYRGKAEVPADWAAADQGPRGRARRKADLGIGKAGGAQASWLAGEGVGSTRRRRDHGGAEDAQRPRTRQRQCLSLLADERHQRRDETGHTLLGKKHLGNPTESKKYSAFKHFSRYRPPGGRCASERPSPTGRVRSAERASTIPSNSLNVSAYLHEVDRTLTVVLVNMQGLTTRQ